MTNRQPITLVSGTIDTPEPTEGIVHVGHREYRGLITGGRDTVTVTDDTGTTWVLPVKAVTAVGYRKPE